MLFPVTWCLDKRTMPGIYVVREREPCSAVRAHWWFCNGDLKAYWI